jgi:sterol-4alpha-carboxylate 3-dehydrogenase (decarboxylating)
MASVDVLGSVLVLGDCGFLGHHMVKELLDTDDVRQVTVFDLNVDSHRLQGAQYILGSITPNEDIMKALQ